MPYIGKQPEHGRFAKLDQINSGFNGSATTFNLTVDSVAVYPTNPQNLLVSLGGVVQQPGTDYTVSAATLTFTTAPAASVGFFGVQLGDVLDIGTPSDSSVTVSKMAANSVDSAQYVDGSIDLVHMSADSVDSNQYVDASIDLAHMSVNSIDSDQYVDGSIDRVHLAADIVDGTKIADDVIDSEHYVAASIDNEHLADDAVGIAELSATGTASSSTFLRGDNSWAAAGVAWQSVVTASTLTAVVGRAYPINTTSNGCTVTLPASPSAGDTIQFIDYARNFGTNSLTLALNSLKFQGQTANAVYGLNGQSISIVYVDTATGWIPTNDVAVALKAPILMKFLVVGGGGGAGGNSAGAGGAGGFRTGSGLLVTSGAAYNIVIGAGGAANGNNTGIATTFAGSGITTITAAGGGYGGTSSPGGESGGDGGSGGGGQSGGGGANGGDGIYDAGETLGTALHQGRDGGGTPAAGGSYPGGGGGGASAVGVTPASNTANGGNGGAGEDQVMGLSASDSMTFMTAVSAGVVSSGARYFAGGGGGANGGTGGVGGGGNGATSGTAGSGVANTGGGAGGASGTGGAGGSGIVILAVLTSDYTGTTTGSPTTATSGDYTLMKFTGNGSYTA